MGRLWSTCHAKRRGYAPAEEDDIQPVARRQGTKPNHLANTVGSSPVAVGGSGGLYPAACKRQDRAPMPSRTLASTRRHVHQRIFQCLLDAAEHDERIVAMTAAIAGPTGCCLPGSFCHRFFDVALPTTCSHVSRRSGHGQYPPRCAVYSTFFSRAFDQANLGRGLHGAPVVFVLDRAGITAMTVRVTTASSTWLWPLHPWHDGLLPLPPPKK